MGIRRISFAKHSKDGTETGIVQLGNFFSFDFSVISEEDGSNLAFGSDDQPVDDFVRNKLAEIRGIEDALLLKTSGQISWFGKSLYKSNPDFLNPQNNPLLQDPHVTGVTVLRRSDKLIDMSLRKLGKIHKRNGFNILNSVSKGDIGSGKLQDRIVESRKEI